MIPTLIQLLFRGNFCYQELETYSSSFFLGGFGFAFQIQLSAVN
jgi:hypothetical protein